MLPQRCKPLHMLYVSVSQTTVADENEDVKELMEVNLGSFTSQST